MVHRCFSSTIQLLHLTKTNRHATPHNQPTQNGATAQAFTRQVEDQLPAFENEDWGLLLYGLASMGQPLSPPFLSQLSAAAGRRAHGLSGDGLGLLVWGLAQYGGPLPLVVDEELGDEWWEHQALQARARPVPPEQLQSMERRRVARVEDWWGRVYAECGLKWESMGPRGAALLLIGIGVLDEAGLAPLPPGEVQSGLSTALRGGLGRHGSWAALVAALRGAAGMDLDERLPVDSVWFLNMVLDWGQRCGLEMPPNGMVAMLAEAAAGGGGGAGELRQQAMAL
jgi:hypothetical protein